jgi:pimeloyl-ACP methyl ester carboxylesterase
MMPTTHAFDIEGHKVVALGFNEDRPGTPVIFLHGIGSSVDFWTVGQVAVFNERFRWYALSLPGHYPAALPSGFSVDNLTAEMIARVLATAIRKLVGDTPVMLVGYSTGGFAALAIAAHSPELVKSVISVAGFVQGVWTGPLGQMQKYARRAMLGRTLLWLNQRAIAANHSVYRMAWKALAADQDALLAFPGFTAIIEATLPSVQRLDGASLLHYYRRMPDIDITDWLPRIAAPVLALAGDHDPIVPVEQSRLIAAGVPSGTLALLAGAGHLPMFERVEEYGRLVTDWVMR